MEEAIKAIKAIKAKPRANQLDELDREAILEALQHKSAFGHLGALNTIRFGRAALMMKKLADCLGALIDQQIRDILDMSLSDAAIAIKAKQRITASVVAMADESFGQTARYYDAVKRIMDICISGIAILATFPLMAIVALAILLESGRPILFRQMRVGFLGKEFWIYKFRSMRQGSEKNEPSWTADIDPRITRVGSLIRKYHLDELPQFFNVLRGDMSLVGPRPEVRYICELLEREVPMFSSRHDVLPGMTGWAQLQCKHPLTIENATKEFELDLSYIMYRSISLDVAIILQTVALALWESML